MERIISQETAQSTGVWYRQFPRSPMGCSWSVPLYWDNNITCVTIWKIYSLKLSEQRKPNRGLSKFNMLSLNGGDPSTPWEPWHLHEHTSPVDSRAKGTTSFWILRKIKYEVGAESCWDWYVTWFMLRNVVRRTPLMSAQFQRRTAAEHELSSVWLEHSWTEEPYFSSHSYFQCLNLFESVSCCSVPELFTKHYLDGLKCWEGECARGVAPKRWMLTCIFRLVSHSFLKAVALFQCRLTPL